MTVTILLAFIVCFFFGAVSSFLILREKLRIYKVNQFIGLEDLTKLNNMVQFIKGFKSYVLISFYGDRMSIQFQLLDKRTQFEFSSFEEAKKFLEIEVEAKKVFLQKQLSDIEEI